MACLVSFTLTTHILCTRTKPNGDYSWTTSSVWPNEGELDIIEGVNQQKQNDYALHTAQGCSIPERGDFTGSVVTPNCDVKALGQAENQGCLVEDTKGSRGYGPDFNNATGGVFATEWTDQAISIWSVSYTHLTLPTSDLV